MSEQSSVNQAYEGTFHGERAVWIRHGRYEAALLPEIGGNLISFRDTELGMQFLHGPTELEMNDFKARPMIHGIPVLYPPNRYEDGKFPWLGQVYHFPVNEPATGNHLHGFFYNTPWQVDDYGTSATESFVVVSARNDPGHSMYAYFPFPFTLTLRYAVGEDGLSQLVTLRNDGSEPIPTTLAFHTAINAPFAPGSSASDCKLKLTIGERWQLNERMLPTGQFQPLQADELAMKGDGVYPFFESLDNHYTAIPQQGRNRMELTDERANVKLVYDVGTSYKQWMIWNNSATEGFFCPEPQVNLVNAPNMDLPADATGLFMLKPGEMWEEIGRLYVIR